LKWSDPFNTAEVRCHRLYRLHVFVKASHTIYENSIAHAFVKIQGVEADVVSVGVFACGFSILSERVCVVGDVMKSDVWSQQCNPTIE
jgi:uncharacterized membrane protein